MRRTFLITVENASERDEHWTWLDLRMTLEGTDHAEFTVIAHQELIMPGNGHGLWSYPHVFAPYFE